MGVLADRGVLNVYHFAPLHYLAFIGRSASLLSKPRLAERGFAVTHFRSMSRDHDVSRGFGDCIHLTLHDWPPIIQAKLGAGFPHIRLDIATREVEQQPHDLCRYNIAMTRYLRRDGREGFPESATNGRYYDERQIPVARSAHDKEAMLDKFLGTQTMIEVLVKDELVLPTDTRVSCFRADDARLAREAVQALGLPYVVEEVLPRSDYLRNERYADEAGRFLARALADSQWLGNGLEYDRV